MASSEMQTLNNAVALLDCFTIQQPELGVREAARLTNLPPSTVGRMMIALKEAGLLAQDPDSRLYHLGSKVLAWAEVCMANFDIRRLALPAMRQLHQDTQETISLYVLEGNERVCVERLESPHNVRIVARIGRRLPLYAGSAGKVMLAFLPEARQEEIIRSMTFQPFTPTTITDPDVLRRELRVIRQQGYAVSRGEWQAEASGVAAPILDSRGQLEAALTISGPSQRFTDEVIAHYAQVVTRVAAQISQELGNVTVFSESWR
jgi:IclR family KDG regulon transcriptional repressor